MISRLGQYRLDRLLGRGGMGEVYRAWDETRDRWVALKVLNHTSVEDEELRARFRREAAIVGSLNEPHIIPVHDFGEVGGRLFLDMRLVDGPDLEAEIRRCGQLSSARTAFLLMQVCAALEAAHGAGLVHRDVKPSNVLVGPGDFAYVVDFGVARWRDGALSTAGTTIPGTLAYLAPERLRGEPADVGSDVYALGCVLYECLTGRRPFAFDDPAEVVAAHLDRPSPHPGDALAAAAAFDAVVERAMSKDIASRFPSCDAMSRAIRDALEATTPARPAPPRSPRGPTVRPNAPRSVTRTLATLTSTMALGPLRCWRLTRRTGRWRIVVFLTAMVLLLLVFAQLSRGYVGGGVAVGLSPVAVAISADGERAVVVDAGSPRAFVLDARRRAVVGRVELGAPAVGAVAAPRSDRLFVVTTTNRRHNDVEVVDLRSASVVGSIPLVDRAVARPALAGDESRLLVPSETGVQVVDLGASRVVRELPVATTAVAVGVDGRQAVSTGSGGGLDVWDVEEGIVTAQIPLGTEAVNLLWGPDRRVYVTGSDAPHAVNEVDPDTHQVTATTPLGAGAGNMALSRDGRRLLVAVDAARPSLVAVDTATRREVGRYFLEPHTGRVALAATPDDSEVFIVNTDLGTLTVDDAGR